MDYPKRLPIISVLVSLLFLIPLSESSEKDDPWKKWLNEVALILTKAERSVFESLEIEEDRKRFQRLFWEVRDPNPNTPQNEYREEFYSRYHYAENVLDGVNSDRGRIYILLGKPIDYKEYSGDEKVVDCELWTYKGEKRPGLPPYMYLLFFKPNNMGFYRLFYPGLHNSFDVLSPGYELGVTSINSAFNLLKMSHPELAYATLSIIPGEGGTAYGQASLSAGSILTQIYTLPEKEVEKNYLQNFKTVEGIVDVTYSVKEIGGKGHISITKNRGYTFLNYSVMPDVIGTIKTSDNMHSAELTMYLRLEDLQGKTIHQQENTINLKIEDEKRQLMLVERKLTFEDFAPIIEGEFNASIIFSNKTTDEHFVYNERIDVNEENVPVIVGRRIMEIPLDKVMPFSTENYRVQTDPRSIYDKGDSLEGIILTEKRPKAYLIDIEDENNSLEINTIVKKGNSFIFRQPLGEIKPGNYFFSAKIDNEEVYNKIVSVLPFKIKKPIDFTRSEPATSQASYTFVIAREYLNKGEVDKAIDNFNRLPPAMLNSKTLPIIARAYYLKKDYEKVTALLEAENVEKTYSVLLLLGNSCLELKKYRRAVDYFERLRKYGDTVEINNKLGALYFSLGEKEKANVYWDRAKELEKKSKKK